MKKLDNHAIYVGHLASFKRLGGAFLIISFIRELGHVSGWSCSIPPHNALFPIIDSRVIFMKTPLVLHLANCLRIDQDGPAMMLNYLIVLGLIQIDFCGQSTTPSIS